MTLMEKMQQWQTDLEELASEKAKAEGRLEQAMDDLKEMGFKDLEEARAELDRLVKAKAKAEADAEELLELFKEKYADYIE